MSRWLSPWATPALVSFLTPWNSDRPIVVHRHQSVRCDGLEASPERSWACPYSRSHCETARPLSGEHPDSTTITSPCRTKRPRTCQRVDPLGLIVVGKLSSRIPGGSEPPSWGPGGSPGTQLNGVPSDSGIREFISGGGGKSLDGFLATEDPGFQVGIGKYGVLKLELSASSYSWEYVDLTGAVVDSGGPVACHG
jgi:hypothetical protein